MTGNPPAPADFFIGPIPIFGRLILAPMDGLSDEPFRWITRCLGSAYSVSEFINTLDYAHQKNYQKDRLFFKAQERPFSVQLLDNDAERMSECAAEIEAEFHPDMFDVNMGCSTSSVMNRGAGVGMMRNPAMVAETFRTLTQTVHVPLTTKMRLGWDDESLNYRQIAELAVENGARAIALHGRTGRMSFSGQARWQPIAELKARLAVPVIGNGDVHTPEDARRMLAETGCDAVMIGRAAKNNPWVFSWRERSEIRPGEVYGLIRYQFGEMRAQYAGGGMMPFRKFVKAYLEPYSISRPSLRALLTTLDEGEFLSLIDQEFTRLGVIDLAGAEAEFHAQIQKFEGKGIEDGG